MAQKSSNHRAWESLSDEALLKWRLRDLPVRIEGELGSRIECLGRELGQRGLRFRPYFWVSDEWFTPDYVPGIAVPFYLTHPRLMALEAAQVGEVEGGEEGWCRKILRHEAGHALANAFRLQRHPLVREVFGPPEIPYPDYYVPRPYSRSYVRHLSPGYAQSHPVEDFAETFAVWLGQSRSAWRRRYAGWPALRKLEVMDALMQGIKHRTPPLGRCRETDPLRRLDTTLHQHYQERRARRGLLPDAAFDRRLTRFFLSRPSRAGRHMTAAAFLRKIRSEARRSVSATTGQYQYTVDGVIDAMIRRSTELDLRLGTPRRKLKADFTQLLAIQTMDFLREGRHRVAL